MKELNEAGNPPRCLSLRMGHFNYRPDYARVGVRFNGEERKDVEFYDADAGRIKTIHGQLLEGLVEPFWRYPENRQMRRARERWEAKQ